MKGIAVEAKYWKKGIGKKLLKAFEKRVKNSGGEKISLGAATNVIGFYTKASYKIIKQKSKFTVMEKKL